MRQRARISATNFQRALGLVLTSTVALASGCGGAPARLPAAGAGVSAATVASVGDPANAAVAATDIATSRASAERTVAPAEHWYFEWLSQDGRRALLRRLDGNGRAALTTRVVDVDSGATLVEETFPELAKLPSATIGTRPNEVAELMGTLASPGLGSDLVRAAELAQTFPFGSCGRLSAAPQGRAIAFNAGDWLYFADPRGRVQKRLTTGAAYDPRFTPNGKYLLFKRATGTFSRGVAKYELSIVPTDFSGPARALTGTAGLRDRVAIDAQANAAIAVASHEPEVATCVLSIGLRAPFSVRRLACLDDHEPFVESVLSPTGRWVALTTQRVPGSAGGGPTTTRAEASAGSSSISEPEHAAFRLRIVSSSDGRVVFDGDAEPGLMVRAVSDDGLVVQSGPRGAFVDDVRQHTRRSLGPGTEIGHRGFFRGPTELVVARASTVRVIDVAAE